MRSLEVASLLCLLCAVLSINAQVIVAPTPPRPSAGTDIVGFILQNPTNQSLPGQHIVFGHPFGKGQVKTTDPSVVVQATGSSTISVQISVKGRLTLVSIDTFFQSV